MTSHLTSRQVTSRHLALTFQHPGSRGQKSFDGPGFVVQKGPEDAPDLSHQFLFHVGGAAGRRLLVAADGSLGA